ncbi:P-loop containing nucleoside triphosphate hydrolase protein [Hesseltinella vesiculosa]|uniref:P-loop containing nucleoside triphosphate hydrolase protein n=1 Tax=Hesseltinella vesiculosa TaxID=101127 RepID=A0A1X2G415_9FUNG|nr:P-loop containing nucleoside triphosphate hydrolase protein [Hesseltinella vesiculosa]
MDTKGCDYLFKVVLAGDATVGKSSLRLRLTENQFDPEITSTERVEFGEKVQTIGKAKTGNQPDVADCFENLPYLDFCRAKTWLWDVPTQETEGNLLPYFRDTSAIVLVYDITQRNTFENVGDTLNKIRTCGMIKATTPVLLVGNKMDLADSHRQVTMQEGYDLARQEGCIFAESSAKTGFNVKNAYRHLLQDMIDNERQKQYLSEKDDYVRLYDKGPSLCFTWCCC